MKLEQEDLETVIVAIDSEGDIIIVSMNPEGITEEQSESLAKILCVLHEPSFVLTLVLNLEMFFRYIAEKASAWIQRKRNDR
jgi:hypothetical protein